ncbi:hypothetical protein WN943_002992 [Citrus x changshan-huyou]
MNRQRLQHWKVPGLPRHETALSEPENNITACPRIRWKLYLTTMAANPEAASPLHGSKSFSSSGHWENIITAP